MEYRCLSCLFMLLVVKGCAASGRTVENLQGLSKTNALRLLVEILIDADDDLTNKTDELQQRLEAQDSEISDLKVKLRESDEKIKELEDKVDSKSENQLVAFSARVTPSYNDIAPWATIRFAHVETNIGEAYNEKTGEFTAPRDGVYAFYSHILSGPKKSIETALRINDKDRLFLYSSGDPSYGSGSNMLVVRLNGGDKVKMIKYGPWGTKPFYIHHSWSTFSGFLLNSDE